MSTPILKMQEIANKKLEAYKSDLIHDGIIIGENKDCNEFIWMTRPSGTEIVPLKPYLNRHGKRIEDLHPLLEYYKSANQHEVDFYHLKNPTNNTNHSTAPGSIEQIDFEQAEKLYWQAQKQKVSQEPGKDTSQGPPKIEDAIYEIDIFSAGDWSVGIPDYHLVLQDKSGAPIMDYGGLSKEDQEEEINAFREHLTRAFEIAAGDNAPIDVRFDSDPPIMEDSFDQDEGPTFR